MVHSKTVKLKGHGSRSSDDGLDLKFYIRNGPFGSFDLPSHPWLMGPHRLPCTISHMTSVCTWVCTHTNLIHDWWCPRWAPQVSLHDLHAHMHSCMHGHTLSLIHDWWESEVAPHDLPCKTPTQMHTHTYTNMHARAHTCIWEVLLGGCLA